MLPVLLVMKLLNLAEVQADQEDGQGLFYGYGYRFLPGGQRGEWTELALSSRNKLLMEDEKEIAPLFKRNLSSGKSV